jgi:RNA polymerase sigma factor for flagellar operon FliA
MATQPVPTHEFSRNAGAAPSLRHRSSLKKSEAKGNFRAVAPSAGSRLLNQEKQHVLVEMLPLVKRMAYRMREHLPAHVEVDDLVGNGVLGLVDAVSKFDSAKRVKLESYARHRIRGSILDGLRSLDPVSRDMRKKNKKVERVYRQLEAQLGRPASDEEIAVALGMSLSQWHHTLREMQSVGVDGWSRAGSAAPTIKHATTEETIAADPGEDPFHLCYQAEQREMMRRALSHLRERDRLIISLYYQDELTMKQIAACLNVDESRISQLHSAALVRLKSCVQALLKPRRPVESLPQKYRAIAA